jgi:hypothetical protein
VGDHELAHPGQGGTAVNADASDVRTRKLRARNLRTLAALAGLFFLPLLLAFYTYYATGWRPAAHTNHGTLITPPRPLPAVSLPRVSLEATVSGAGAPAASAAAAPASVPTAGSALFRKRWSLVYVGDGACDASCRYALYAMRQTRLSLNADMARLERVFLATGSCCNRELLAREHAGLIVVDASGAEGARLLREFPAAGREHTLFIVDPLGNLMMSYDARTNPGGLREDLRRLLRLSHIG